MLFNSFEFIVIFLPACLLLFFTTAKRWGNQSAIATLVACSLFFYAWWNPSYLILLVGSMVFNYWIGKTLGKKPNKPLLTFGIVTNLTAIAYFKYAGFIVLNINAVASTDYNLGTIILPLAISFFTFQQIAYLVDSHKGITHEYSFLHYALFVSFFPQLIAGPIVHHKEMLPQFERKSAFTLNAYDVQIGLSIFAIGLFKKTVLADGIAVYATPIFSLADQGTSIDFFAAWSGVLAYTFQLYFDFSGYSDMAIGLARIFGIVLPLNFYSPYKATNISEFWRRWHMTLSKFLRDYVYIALGGNRKGNVKRYSNLLLTMLLGGLWHGAGWNFVIWGALHGSYLVINHAWQYITQPISKNLGTNFLYKYFSWFITFTAVIIGWVFFRATTLDGAINLLQGMIGMNDIFIPNAIVARAQSIGVDLASFSGNSVIGGTAFIKSWLWILGLLSIVLVLPTVQDIFSKHRSSLNMIAFETNNALWPAKKLTYSLQWLDKKHWAILTGAMLAFGFLTLSQVSEFLYFQF
ncbi:MBOAT family O-acyltransferase [Thalassotalea fusca]